MKVKIFGAGSIGNHLANASRHFNWDVTICDNDPKALKRTQFEIYPSRYGYWDDEIKLMECNQLNCEDGDLVLIGTPPDSHIAIALKILESGSRPIAIMIEKPVCPPDLDDVDKLYSLANKLGISLFVGYDHVVSNSTSYAEKFLKTNNIGVINTLDVEFREFWGGIFNAHPWLDGPHDSYLGFWKKGGGASSEHSHAINLWQHLASSMGFGKIKKVSAHLDFIKSDKVDYDSICAMHFVTETGFFGRCIQDVVTSPPRKWFRVQGSEGFLECNIKPSNDEIHYSLNQEEATQQMQKTRPEDFILELGHISSVLESNKVNSSPIEISKGFDTMLVVAAAHLSSKTGKQVSIDYTKGYNRTALIVD